MGEPQGSLKWEKNSLPVETQDGGCGLSGGGSRSDGSGDLGQGRGREGRLVEGEPRLLPHRELRDQHDRDPLHTFVEQHVEQTTRYPLGLSVPPS